MQKPFTCLLTTAAILAIATPAQSRCDDNVSYMIDRYGQCVDLTDTTNLGIAAAQRDYINREINPFRITNLVLQPSLKAQTEVTGKIMNHSSKTMIGGDIVLRFERRRDGKTEVIGMYSVDFNDVIPSGKEYKFKATVPNPGLGVRVAVESATPAYRDE